MTNRPWTPRETEVVRLTADGLTAQQIARRLVLAPKTVENHIWRAKQKADCPNRAALVRYAITRGLIDPAPTDDDRADAELDRLICHLDSDTVIDVKPVTEEPAVVETAAVGPRPGPRRAFVAIILAALSLVGIGAYAAIRAPDAPPAAPAVAVPTTSAPSTTSTTSAPSTTRKRSAPTVDTTLDELRTTAKRAARDAARSG